MCKRHKKTFYRKGCTCENKHLERCATLLLVWAIRITTTVEHHSMPVRMAKVKNHDSTKCRIEQKIDYLNIFDGNVKWYNHSEKHFECVLFVFFFFK